MSAKTRQKREKTRRGAIIVQVALTSTLILGFGAHLGGGLPIVADEPNSTRACDLMPTIAANCHGQEFFASGSPEEYTEQLEDIFRALGGKRPVTLIE